MSEIYNRLFSILLITDALWKINSFCEAAVVWLEGIKKFL